MKMYLSTLFLTEMKHGAEYAAEKCNEEFLKRFGTIRDYKSVFFVTDSCGKVIKVNSLCDEMMALWDVFKDFKDEIFKDLPVIEAMNTICEVRGQMKGVVRA